MEFDFLPNLPKSDLDDRTFKDLVEECILRIPRYCPEWTNYNPSDPGITLIELFAWLTDQMMLRFNQVPRRNYVAFLELLGIRLQAPTPAKTDVTFYLSSSLPETYTIPEGTEIATLRTETEEAIVFSTDRQLQIGNPSILHFLTAEMAEDLPQILRDRFGGLWTLSADGHWSGRELAFFNEQPHAGNCFYLVFDPGQPIDGNVIAVNFQGEAATSTGINPEAPPRRWEAWNGRVWEPVLMRERDDRTKGFSFSEIARAGGNPLQGADIVLHMPQFWPVTQFATYQGRWVRCVYADPLPNQSGYISSPRIVGLSVRAIGGTVGASQSELITNEPLGESNGKPGQTFQLMGSPALERKEKEYILVTPPGELPQRWYEVMDFANSGPQDRHYTIDSRTGTVQFGPLIREPGQIQQQTMLRAKLQMTQAADRERLLNTIGEETVNSLERQYGAVPPRGSTITMVAYRIGGGVKGNVQVGSIRVLKNSVPYVANIVNYKPGRNGANAESLEEAVIRVPAMLRTRDRAVTPEDFEALTIKAANGAIARARCLPAKGGSEAGIVRLLVIPHANTEGIARSQGIDPDQLALSPQLSEQILAYLNERRLLGVQVCLQEPEYVGVAVQTEVALEAEYQNPRAQQEILSKLQVALYRFLNPLTGGMEGKGWPFGRPVYPSDIVTLFQQIAGVRYLGVVQLFELRKQGTNWVRSLPQNPVIAPGPLGLVCSWQNAQLRSGHIINLI
ncbi:hypothetical protein NIES4072_64930 [Nostoc commune NIES-4072]|uniref:Uncharacterized protein n=1 Tax=Nostoc commune NIES-4072 TaxID=2005467 RepID=A0A2R5G401_NOSCO|nr:putative baseplate assembly protein [Nostoc commune]BBD70128.1 hypothetical protein NIES4070_65390 [Nostoc commune HK-02]GBG22781.1 hypothetical protein NIES4072_64930 [Nostoc commune NIES-4072]